MKKTKFAITKQELEQLIKYLGCVDKTHPLKSKSVYLMWSMEEKLRVKLNKGGV